MLHYICALPAEAKPLIEHFGLQRLEGPHPFAVYAAPEKQTSLTISGIGKVAAAAAVAYSHSALGTDKPCVWLNVGLAGHAAAKLGELLLANSIYDKATGKIWYPVFAFERRHKTAACITLDQASTEYEQQLFDMEASGFYQSSLYFSIHELIHVMKVVSDNSEHPVSSISKKTATELIAGQLAAILAYSQQLRELAAELDRAQSKPRHYESMQSRWHFSRTQQIQLEKQLRRWDALMPEDTPLPSFHQLPSAREVLSELTRLLDAERSIYD